jgi:hypothetical protein
MAVVSDMPHFHSWQLFMYFMWKVGLVNNEFLAATSICHPHHCYGPRTELHQPVVEHNCGSRHGYNTLNYFQTPQNCAPQVC